MKQTELERLRTVADAAFQKETAILRKILSADAALSAEARKLRQAVPAQDLPFAVQSAAGGPWRRWRDWRLAEIERGRAALLADRDKALTNTRHAFGRFQVLGELAHKAARR